MEFSRRVAQEICMAATESAREVVKSVTATEASALQSLGSDGQTDFTNTEASVWMISS